MFSAFRMGPAASGRGQLSIEYYLELVNHKISEVLAWRK